ncbi:uncharacterized protein LOC100891861 [Strongylocentrotus purpuratus]|uniref:Uncharacterized protein n=1 Tax=Strongylocentrotus purpuratus TaxID=7668 RepID=A0A7M7NN66_STRPU|nr:uncharacterized protein LOC100891861 [Strongylocentrotus purpuratus]
MEVDLIGLTMPYSRMWWNSGNVEPGSLSCLPSRFKLQLYSVLYLAVLLSSSTYKLMMEKEQEREEERESYPPKYESDYGEHGPIAGKPPNQDRGQPKNKQPPPDLANFEQNGDSPPFNQNNNADVKDRGCTTPPGVDIAVGDKPQSSRIEDIAGLPHGDHPSLRIENMSPLNDGMKEGEKLSQPTSLLSKDGKVPLPPLPDVEEGILQAVEMPNTHLSGGEQFSMPKSLSSQLDEEFSQPTSLSSKDGNVPLPPLPDVEGDIPNTHLSEGEQFSMPKSLTSQMDKIRVKRVSSRQLNRNKFTRASGRQGGRELKNRRREVDRLNVMRDRNTSGGLNGANADRRGTIPWQIYVYNDLKKMLVEFTRVYLPKMACWSITLALGYICGRNE